MSKPDKPGELRGVTVEAISLVSKAANGEKFKIFKSADEEPPAPEVVKKDERGLFRILKEFFTGTVDESEKVETVEPEVSVVEKSGRKISSDRLGKLKNIQAIINDVLSGLDDDNTPKEAEALTKEEIQKTVDEAVKAVNVEEVVKKALEPVLERLEKIENARGVSNRVPEDSAVEKSSSDFWGGIF